MELNTTRAVITAAEPMGSILQEQGVELDYVLPDYYPDVCKLVKCFVTPSVTSQSISSGRLSYELCCEVRILYCSEDSHVLQCVTQTLRFPRTAELPAGEELTAEILPAADYVNCRAVSRRRLDVRGAVTIRIRPSGVRMQEALSDAAGSGLQLRRIPVQYPERTIRTSKSILLSEELELGAAKPPVLHVVRCDARAVDLMQKRVSGKLMVNGSLQLQILYACEKDGDGSLEPMQFRIPFSQLLEPEGLAEEDPVRVSCTVTSCDLKSMTDAAGEVRMLRCEAELNAVCTSVHMASGELVADAFSTEGACELKTVSLVTASLPEPFSETAVSGAKLTCTDGELDCVYDAWCEVRNLTTAAEPGELVLSGMLCCNVLVRESSGMPRLLEKEEPFEHRIPMPQLTGEDLMQVSVTAENCAYTLTGACEVTVKAELRMEGTVTRCTRTEAVAEITLPDGEAQPRDYALLLYFGRAGEPVWDIAKRCRTSVDAILDENELAGDVLPEDAMLLIPIVG